MNIHCSFSSLLKLLSVALTIPVEAILLLSQEIIKAQIFPVPPSLTSYHPWLLLSKHFLIILNFVMGNPHSVNYLLLYTEILNNSLTLKFFRFLKQLYFQVQFVYDFWEIMENHRKKRNPRRWKLIKKLYHLKNG